MQITKFGHCCLLIEEGGVKLLTDLGSFTTTQNSIAGIDAVLITHEHGDHFHLESVKEILKNNPQCMVITNGAVGALLEKEGVPHLLVGDGKRADVKGVPVAGFGRDHAIIYEQIGQVENTGFYIAEKLFYPGDALYKPNLASIEILALPVAGPWMKIGEALDYARAAAPKAVFPVHDGIIRDDTGGFLHAMVENVLQHYGVAFTSLREGGVHNF